MKIIYVLAAIQFVCYAVIIWALVKFVQSDTAEKIGNKFERWLEE